MCADAEQQLACALDPARYQLQMVHLGRREERIAEAERAGVRSVPALVLDERP